MQAEVAAGGDSPGFLRHGSVWLQGVYAAAEPLLLRAVPVACAGRQIIWRGFFGSSFGELHDISSRQTAAHCGVLRERGHKTRVRRVPEDSRQIL